MSPLYYEKKIVKKLIQHDSLVLLANGFNELNILAIFIFYYQNRCLWYEKYITNDENIFFGLFKLNIHKDVDENELFKNSNKQNYENLNEFASTSRSEVIIDNIDCDSGNNPKECSCDGAHKTIRDGHIISNKVNFENKNKLIFILNVSPKEYNLFLKYQLMLCEGISKFDKVFNDSVKINYLKTQYIRNQKSNERIEMYIRRGVYFISSNVLLIDLLTFKIIPEIIDGIFICKSHKLIYSVKELFIIELYRKRNKYGFIKGISNNKKLINNQHILNIAHKLYMKKVYCYPRFHKNVHLSLNNKFIQPNIYEINLNLPTSTNKIEENILNLIHYLNLEIKKFHTFHDFDINSLLYSDSAENYTMNYIKTKSLTYNTKKLLKEIITLVNILYNLYIYDDVIFYNYLKNLKEADKESTWMYCNEANEIFHIANQRKNMFLNKINMDNTVDANEVDNIQTIIHRIQYEQRYFHKSYEIKREQNEIYKWIYELVYKRDINIREYKKILLKKKKEKKKYESSQSFLNKRRNCNTGKEQQQNMLLNGKVKTHFREGNNKYASLCKSERYHDQQSEMEYNSEVQNYTSNTNTKGHMSTSKLNNYPSVDRKNIFNYIKNKEINSKADALDEGDKDSVLMVGHPKVKQERRIYSTELQEEEREGASKGEGVHGRKAKEEEGKENERIIHSIVMDRAQIEEHKNCHNSSSCNSNNNNSVNNNCSNSRSNNGNGNSYSSSNNEEDEGKTLNDGKQVRKVDYPIAIIVDNFYTQKEFYNLLIHKNENNVNLKFFLKSEEKMKVYNISDDSSNGSYESNMSNSSNSSNSSYSSKKTFQRDHNFPSLDFVNFHIPNYAIKEKTDNLKYIKPHVYILCINKNYDTVYTSENFLDDCSEKMNSINRATHKGCFVRGQKEGKTDRQEVNTVGLNNSGVYSGQANGCRVNYSKDRPSKKNQREKRFFEINEYCGNLDFLELFLMWIKPYRIILTTLDLSIFRNVEIYCARLFQHNVYKLHKESFFNELMNYEENNLMYDSISEERIFVKKEQQQKHQQLKRKKISGSYDSDKGKQVSSSCHSTRTNRKNDSNCRYNKETAKQREKDRGVNNFKIIKVLHSICNTVEVFLIFYKNNILYNKYLNSIKTEKSNWFNFIENKNNLRFEVDRNVFNKNLDLFKKVVDAYFLFQKKFKENKKNIINFNKALCEEFKVFQDVKLDEHIENKNVILSSALNSNYISMEEEELFIENYKNKINKKSDIVPLDEKTIQKIQELLQKFSIDSFNLNFILYSIFNNTKPIVIVDIRELKSDLSYKLYKSKMHIIPYSLLVGDYILTKDICVERKTIVDLIQSLNNNRLYNQIKQMSKYYSMYLLLIEFNTKHLFYFSSLNDKHSIYTKLIILCLQYPRLRILWSPFSLFTVKLFWALKVNSEQPDIFKSLHIDLTLQKHAHRPIVDASTNGQKGTGKEEELEMGKEKAKQEQTIQKNMKTEKNKGMNKEEEQSSAPPRDTESKNDVQLIEPNKVDDLKNNSFDSMNNNRIEEVENYAEGNGNNENEHNEEFYKYETINDLFDKNLNNLENVDTSKTFKKMESVTNWNALEILKALPGVTEKNMHLIINNVNSLYDLCEKTVEELESYMSKNNAKLLYDFLNTDVS
ncbi:DNA repair endonuclease, putative [Plasmodium malariae]|uniref:DNA repair endonuclease, putative n=1 Tax=Plasmodium malariae TaxID=5858 RepID=A0A1D3SNB3_PLAMA|nr:DNA repair endonuclease, putative [Plasmodium malariae]SCO92923.1 DNA repair endonuclease, putative [Plasmodium malariae]